MGLPWEHIYGSGEVIGDFYNIQTLVEAYFERVAALDNLDATTLGGRTELEHWQIAISGIEHPSGIVNAIPNYNDSFPLNSPFEPYLRFGGQGGYINLAALQRKILDLSTYFVVSHDLDGNEYSIEDTIIPVSDAGTSGIDGWGEPYIWEFKRYYRYDRINDFFGLGFNPRGFQISGVTPQVVPFPPFPLTKKYPREIGHLNTPGESGQIARFCSWRWKAVPSGTGNFTEYLLNPGISGIVNTPSSQLYNSGKIYTHDGSKWNEWNYENHSEVPEPDLVESSGFITDGDYIGPWIANDIVKMLKLLRYTYRYDDLRHQFIDDDNGIAGLSGVNNNTQRNFSLVSQDTNYNPGTGIICGLTQADRLQYNIDAANDTISSIQSSIPAVSEIRTGSINAPWLRTSSPATCHNIDNNIWIGIQNPNQTVPLGKNGSFLTFRNNITYAFGTSGYIVGHGQSTEQKIIIYNLPNIIENDIDFYGYTTSPLSLFSSVAGDRMIDFYDNLGHNVPSTPNYQAYGSISGNTSSTIFSPETIGNYNNISISHDDSWPANISGALGDQYLAIHNGSTVNNKAPIFGYSFHPMALIKWHFQYI